MNFTSVRTVFVLAVITTLVTVGVALAQTPSDQITAMANPAQGTTSGGQLLEINITTPNANQAFLPDADVDVAGQVGLGGITDEVNVMYVVDVSGSTGGNPGENDCDGNGIIGDSGDDYNSDGSQGDTLDCEIAGVLALDDSLIGIPGVKVGLTAFATSADFYSNIGFVDPGDPGLRNTLQNLDSLDNTYFDNALNEMTANFPSTGRNIAFFMTDGAPSQGHEGTGTPLSNAVAKGITVNTFSIGSSAADCTSNQPVYIIADRSGGVCQRVLNPSDLGVTFGAIRPIGLDRVEVKFNGVPLGPAELNPLGSEWDLIPPLTGLQPGPNRLEATVYADDGTAVTADIIIYGAGLELSPEMDYNPIGTQHTVVATLYDTTTVGQAITFEIYEGPNAGTTETVTTNANGQASFTFSSTVVGTDKIRASYTHSTGDVLTAEAEKVWSQITFTDSDPEFSKNDPNCVFTSILYDDQGNLLPNQQVVYTITHPDGTQTAQVVSSDANGRVTIPGACDAIGEHSLDICLDTNDNGTCDANEVRQDGPTATAITLLSFTAEAGDDQVTLAWETASELDNEGFNIWRSTSPDGGFAKLNPELIAPQGDELTGASYSFVDTTVESGTTYYYQLEDVDFNGVTTLHQVVSVDLTTADEFEPVEPPTSFDEDEMFKPNEE